MGKATVARRRTALVMAAMLALGAILLGAALAAGQRSAPGGEAGDPSPCAALAGVVPHCDWFGDNGMDLPAEVAVMPRTALAPAAACIGDGRDGKRVQPVLFVPEGTKDGAKLERQLFQVRSALQGVDVAYQQSGLKTGTARTVRWVTGPDCQPDIQVVEVPEAMLSRKAPSFGDAMRLVAGAPDESFRLYLGFWTEGPSWGIAELTGDDRPGRESANWNGNRFGLVYGIPSAYVAAHELGHLLGAVNVTAPNSSGYGHCTSLFDVLCYSDGAGVRMNRDCPFTQFNRLDCGNDDYFASVPQGSYLQTHWNVAGSPFLAAGSPEPCLDVAMEPDTWRSVYLNMINIKKVFAAPILKVGGTQRRAFCGELDWSDRARVTVRADTPYRVEVRGLEGATSTLIRIWDPVNRRYVASNAGSSHPFSLSFTPDRRGAFGVEVINRHPGEGSGVPFTIRIVAGEDR